MRVSLPIKSFCKEGATKSLWDCGFLFFYASWWIWLKCDLFPRKYRVEDMKMGEMIFVKVYASQNKYKKENLLNSIALSWIYWDRSHQVENLNVFIEMWNGLEYNKILMYNPKYLELSIRIKYLVQMLRMWNILLEIKTFKMWEIMKSR